MHLIWDEDFSKRTFRLKKQILEMDKLKDVKISLTDSLRGKFPSELTVLIKSRSPAPADFFQCGAMRVVSEDLKEFLTAWPVTGAEFFPVRIIQNGETSARNFFCFHLTEEVDCVDLERTKYTPYEGAEYLRTFERLVLDESKAEGHALFRLARFYRTVICAEEALAGAIRKARFTGIKFYDPQDWPSL